MKAHFAVPFIALRLFVGLCLAMLAFRASAALSPQEKLGAYRGQLEAFRAEFGGAHELPNQRFFLFGMGQREKYLYRDGTLMNAHSGEVIQKWDVRDEVILPDRYEVWIRTKRGGWVMIFENEEGVWMENTPRAPSKRLPGTKARVHLPGFDQYRYPAVMRVLHQELLVNVTTNGPVPNLFVYAKPWYRDGAMMALAFKETGNLDVIRDWILNLHEPYDRNNNGETEADNLGQALFLISLVSNTNHPLVAKILSELPKFEQQRDGKKFIKGRSDFAEHPVYQTKWLKFGLRALGLPDGYSIPQQKDSYSALFWMDYKDAYVPGDANDRGNYPYLGWACDHFHGEKKSPISNRDYPLTWEAKASQAKYEKLNGLSSEYVKAKLAAPHTWHAAEVFLYLIESERRTRR